MILECLADDWSGQVLWTISRNRSADFTHGPAPVQTVPATGRIIGALPTQYHIPYDLGMIDRKPVRKKGEKQQRAKERLECWIGKN